MMRRGACALICLLVLVGCGTKATPPKAVGTAKPKVAPASLRPYYKQRLQWFKCSTFRCAFLEVPLDYAHPHGARIKLAVLKVEATDPAHKVGDLVVNPGGPGGSGVQFAEAAGSGYFHQALTDHFDIVGFDPRGVGESTAITCGNTAQTDAMVGTNPEPSTPAQWAQVAAVTRAYDQRCLKLSGPLAAHVSTIEAAKDMDILRAALGQPKLDYLGASYGTFLGATYAGLFPGNVGRMVLDGALDPALSSFQLTLQQAHGFEVALRSYVADCVPRRGCPLGTSVDQGIARLQALIARTATHPLPTGSARQLNQGLLLYGLFAPLYVKYNWPQLTSALREVLTQGSGRQMLALADTYTSRGPTAYQDNSIAAQNTINCLDHDDYTPWQQVARYVAQFLKAAPTFGRAFAAMLAACQFFPVQDHDRTSAIRAAGAPPILVIGTTRDPATPLAWARALAGQLASGVLITRNGDGHTGYNMGNDCVDSAVEKYLVSGVVPPNRLAC